MTIVRTGLLAALFASAFSTHANNQQVVTIKGVVFAAVPCVINNNAPINAPFGDVQTSRIDGNYRTITLDYLLDCSRAANNELRMQVRGNNAGFDSSLLMVPGKNNLGVALKKDGNSFAINTWADFDTNRQPLLQAVLVKNQNGEVEAGEFKASATLVVDYR